MAEQTTSNTRGQIVMLSALGINLVLGVLYAWGVMKQALKVEWKWTDTQAALPFSVSTAAFALTMVFAGRMQDKIGPRRIALLGGLMLGLGLIASSLTRDPNIVLLTFGVIGGMGIGLGYSATTPPSIKWFPPARKGLVTGIVVSGVGLAAVWISPLTQYLLGVENRISQTFLVLGIGTIIIVSLLALLLRNPPAGYQPPVVVRSAAISAPTAPIARRDYDWHEMLRTMTFWRLWIMFILTASAGLMVIAHAATIAKNAGMKWGFMPIVLLAIFNTAGRLISGVVSDRIGRTQTMVLAFLLQALNMFLFQTYTTPQLVLFGAAFTGLCYGTIFTLMPAAIADFYGVRNLGVNYGLLFTGFGVAGIVGPIIASRMYDTYKSYNNSYTACAVMLLLGALMAFSTRAPKVVVPEPEKAAV